MFISSHPFVAGQPLHVELPAAGVEVVDLVNDTMDEILAGLALVQVCKGLDSGLVVSEDGQVLVGFVCGELQGDPCELGCIYYINSSLAK